MTGSDRSMLSSGPGEKENRLDIMKVVKIQSL